MRFLIPLLIISFLFVSNVKAQFTGDITVHTIAQIMEMSDDTDVIAEGYITSSIGDEKYIFTDESGEIRVEIDDDLWRGREVDSQTKIRIFGEFDKKWLRSSEIEVERFEIL